MTTVGRTPLIARCYLFSQINDDEFNLLQICEYIIKYVNVCLGPKRENDFSPYSMLRTNIKVNAPFPYNKIIIFLIVILFLFSDTSVIRI